MSPLTEESALLPRRQTPLPYFQLCIVLVLQLAEPLTSQVIYPFAPQLIRDLGITNGDESKVGYYVGIMQSLFFLTQAFTVLYWSRVSDRIGRKPVVLTGLAGLSVSMYCFGLSTTFWGLVISRCLNGALNGNIGVMKSILAEITDSTNISKAYAYMPLSWSTGATLGPIIGGSLSKPAERFPTLFGNSEFLKKYPYFLPCAVPATFSLVAWVITYLFLQESAPKPMPVSQFLGLRRSKSKSNFQTEDAKITGVTGSISQSEEQPLLKSIADDEKVLPLKQLLTRQVILAAGNYASLSLIDIALRAVQPVFLSTPIALGGLGLPPAAIGKVLSLYGILNGACQILLFAQIHDRYGSKRVFVWGLSAALPAFAMFPIINLLARHQGYSIAVWVAVAAQSTISIAINFSYGAIFIFIADASPNRASLGATNGLSQMTVSIMRAIGPAASNSLFSISIQKNYMGGYLVYYVLISLVCIGLYIGSLLPRNRMARL